MAKLGSITINEIEMIEVDASPIVDGFDAPSGSLAILTDGTALYLKTTGGPTVWQNVGSFGPNVKRVSPAGAQYNSIATALAACTSPSTSNRYVIYIEPGTYSEPQLDIPSYVSLVGMDEKAVVITPAGSHHIINLLGQYNYISFLSLESGVAGFAALNSNDNGSYNIIHKVHIATSELGISVSASTTDTYLYTEYCDIEECTASVTVNGTGALAYSQNENLYIGNYTTTPSGVAVTATGNSNFIMQSGSIENLATPGTGDGLLAYNGANIEIANTIIANWDNAVNIQNTGSAPNVLFRFPNFRGNTSDLNIAHTGTTGVVAMFGDRAKVTIASSSLALDILDTTNPAQVTLGKFYTGDTYNTIADYAQAFKRQFSPGLNKGGVVSHSAASFVVNVTAGNGYVVLDSGLANEYLKDIEFSAQSVTIAANTEAFLYVDSNGVLQQSASSVNYFENIVLGSVISDGAGVYLNKDSSRTTHYADSDQEEMLRHTIGSLYASGSIVSEHTTARQIAVTGGEYYYGSQEYKPQGATPATMLSFYRNGSGGFTKASLTTIAASSSTWKYDNNSGTLQNIPLLQYANYRLYVMFEPNDGMETYFLVYPQNTHLSQASAENEALPTVPSFFDKQIVHIADIIVLQGSTNIHAINDKRPLFLTQANVSSSSGVTDHTALTNLTAGDSGHTQFVMTDGSKPMSGGLSITSASNQLTLSSSTNQLILTSGTSAAARTYTIPDVGPTGVLAMLEGAQTFSGAKTFSNAPTFSSLLANQALYLNGSKLLTGATLSNGNLLVGATGSTPVVGSITTDANLTSTFTSPNIVISLNNSGVTAGTYGSNLQIPVITTDAKGRVTSVVNTAVDVQLSGDVTSTLSSDTVVTKIQGNPVTAGTPLVGQAYIWNGSSFVLDRVDTKSNKRSKLFDDFLTGSTISGTVGELGWVVTNSGTAAGVRLPTALGTNEFGMIGPATGTTTTGRSTLSLNSSSIILGNGVLTVEARVYIPTIADATNNYIFRIGLGDVTTAGDMVDGVYFEYNRLVSASNWLIKTANNSVRTETISTGIINIATWMKLKFISNDIGSSTDFYVNDVLVGTIGTNHPVAVGRQTGPIIKIEKSAGTTARSVNIDYYSIEKVFTTAR